MARVNAMTDMSVIAEVMEVRDAFKGMKICITGHLGRKREDIVKLIESGGGVFHDNIKAWNTTHLLTNADWTKNSINGKVSGKFAKAQQYRIKIISEQQFYDMMLAAEAREQSTEGK